MHHVPCLMVRNRSKRAVAAASTTPPGKARRRACARYCSVRRLALERGSELWWTGLAKDLDPTHSVATRDPGRHEPLAQQGSADPLHTFPTMFQPNRVEECPRARVGNGVRTKRETEGQVPERFVVQKGIARGITQAHQQLAFVRQLDLGSDQEIGLKPLEPIDRALVLLFELNVDVQLFDCGRREFDRALSLVSKRWKRLRPITTE